MKILFLGDVVGPSGRKVIFENLPTIIRKKKLDFVVVNGENSADPGVGITKDIANEFFKSLTAKRNRCNGKPGVNIDLN